jgi:hypothetical protein
MSDTLSAEASLRRSVRIPLAACALLLVAGGAWLGRIGVASRLRATFDGLAADYPRLSEREGEPARALLERSRDDARPERLGAAVLAAGCLLVIVTAAATTRARASTAAAAFLVGLVAMTLEVGYPSALVPGIATVRAPPDEWPYGAVAEDRESWTAFIIISERREWAAAFLGNELGPDGLGQALARRLGTTKRRVRLFFDPRCPDEARALFEKAVADAATGAGVAYSTERLCERDDFAAMRRLVHDQALGVFREIALFGSLSRFAWALALALVVWQADVRTKGARGTSLLAGGELVLAFGQVVALPVLLYVGMLPEERFFKNPFVRLGENAQHYEILLTASAAIMTIGAGLAFAGQLLAPDAATEVVPRGDGAVLNFTDRLRTRRAKALAQARPADVPRPEALPGAAPLAAAPAPEPTAPAPETPSPQASDADAKKPSGEASGV